MSSSPGPVRSGRRPLHVGVVDAGTPVGRAALVALVSAAARPVPGGGGPRIGTVTAVSPEPPDVGGTHWREGTAGDPSLALALEGVDVVVYSAASTALSDDLALGEAVRRARSRSRAQTVVSAAAAAGAGHLVVVTSAMVYGARPDNPVPLPDDAPLRAPAGEGQIGDLVDVEQLVGAARRAHPALRITVVRPAALVGPGVDTVVTRHFEAPRLLTVRGAEPAWQFCHLDDLGSAVALVAARRLEPAVTVGCEGWLSQAEAQRLTGMRRVELSLGVAQGTAERLHRVGVLPAPTSDLAFAVHPWAVASGTLRAAGWEPAYDNATCLGVLLEGIRGSHALVGRRVDRRDAALGAASAAVALVGTAALVRRHRKGGTA